MNKPMILIVEDDAAVRNLISTTLKMQNYKFTRSNYRFTGFIRSSIKSTRYYAIGFGAS